jgi:hypothetical protein
MLRDLLKGAAFGAACYLIASLAFFAGYGWSAFWGTN